MFEVTLLWLLAGPGIEPPPFGRPAAPATAPASPRPGSAPGDGKAGVPPQGAPAGAPPSASAAPPSGAAPAAHRAAPGSASPAPAPPMAPPGPPAAAAKGPDAATAKGGTPAGKPVEPATARGPVPVPVADEGAGSPVPKTPAPSTAARHRRVQATDSAAPAKNAGEPVMSRTERGVAALSVGALRDELRRAIPGDDRPAMAKERARLETLAAEVSKAREALRQDTAKLEAMLQRSDVAAVAGRPAASGPGTMQRAEAPEKGFSATDIERKQIESLAKAMKGMKPDLAAPILGRLDRALAAELLRRMRPADAGAILGSLKPDVAADLATEMATKASRLDGGRAEPRR